MLAEDFGGKVALDTLGADVPARHPPLGIKHEQRVVGDTLDKEPETALTIEQIALLSTCLVHQNPAPIATNVLKADFVPEQREPFSQIS
jgi:hypothetical protein